MPFHETASSEHQDLLLKRKVKRQDFNQICDMSTINVTGFCRKYYFFPEEDEHTNKGSIGKLIHVRPLEIAALNPRFVGCGVSQSGNRCMAIFTVDTFCSVSR